MKPSRCFRIVGFCAASTVALAAPAASAKEKFVVNVSYLMRPAQTLPENVHTVAVIDSGVDSDEQQADFRERRWSQIAADLIEAMLQSAPGEGAAPVKIVERRATKHILAEQDLQLVGIVEGDAAARAGKLLAADALAMSRINIHISTKRSSKSEIDWMAMLGGSSNQPRRPRDPRLRHAPGGPRRNPYAGPLRGPLDGGLALPTRQIEEISRSLTVQGTFVLVDAVTGQTLAKVSTPVLQKTDKTRPNFLFGSQIDEADLDPVDHFIGELVERGARDFVGAFAPVRVSYDYEVIGRGDDGEKAVRSLRADDFKTALELFEREFKDDPEEPDTVFALGVTSELVGDPERALQYYRKVAAMEDVDDDDLPMILDAKNRLTAHLPRIVPNRPPGEPTSP